ncbi:hypothetical protein LMTR13_07860 [Bradyrhizobium icense]|uniref:Uncharacterized protein n=1 Tax=Bradyrhizobium icense TaxID=1274631 RepID=A0A1B1UBH6_9BRAD|nr:hypothetical protein LMTR13_07860 [Bradyrhizobium icense]
MAIATAAIGYTVNFVDTHRKAQIEKVDRQIEKLYGPLYAYSTASHRAWYDLRRVTDRGTYFFDSEDKHMPSAELVEVWRRWMRTVFMPLNLKIEAAIVDNAQLLDGNRIYPCFVDLVSHVESYKATLASWKDTDDLTDSKRRTKAANTAVIEYPRDLESCIENRLQASLKRRKELERSWTGLFQGEPESSVPEPCKCKNKDPNLSNIVE